MKKVIQTDKAPKAIGPYSQAIQAGSLLFLSGQIALDPKTGEMAGGDVGQQTQQVLENIKGLLESQGLGMRGCDQGDHFSERYGELQPSERRVCRLLLLFPTREVNR